MSRVSYLTSIGLYSGTDLISDFCGTSRYAELH